MVTGMAARGTRPGRGRLLEPEEPTVRSGLGGGSVCWAGTLAEGAAMRGGDRDRRPWFSLDYALGIAVIIVVILLLILAVVD
jgi:hypothetical protein